MVALFAITAFAAQIWKAESNDVFTVTYDGSEVSSPADFFTHDADGKFNFNNKFAGTYDGKDYTKGLKMEGTTKILFTTEEVSTVTIVQSTQSSNTIKLDDVELAVADAVENTEGKCRVYTVTNVAPGDHTITRGSGESGLLYIRVEYTAGGDEPTPSDEHYYKKVTSTSDLTDGNYLIVYEDGGVALDGALSDLDVTGNNFNVTITDNQIASSDAVDGAVFTIEGLATTSTTGGYSIKSASGFYIGQETDANGLASNAETVYANQISFETNGDANIVGAGGAYLRYNAASNQARFRYYKSSSYTNQKPVALYKKVDGALTPADIATPVIKGETPFVGSTTVTITCETEGAAIYYSTDGVDPTDQSTAYTEPFELTESATVKAIAYDASGAKSAVASKVFEATPSVATIAAMNALENDAAFGFTGNALIVAKPTAKHVFIKDDTGSSLLYDNSGEKTAAAEVGKVIAPNWTAKVSIYKNLFEAVPDAAIEVTSDDPVDVTYPEVELAYITAEHVNEVVTLKGVNYTAPDNKNFNVTKGTDNTVAGYNQFGIEIANPDETKTYDIVGAIGRYNDNIQFQPITITEAADEPAPEENVLWSSAEPVAVNWSGDVNIAADKLVDATVGDIIHVAVEGVNAGGEWSAQVAIKCGADNWPDLEAGVPVGTGRVEDAAFVITGDILKAIQTYGLIVSGNNYSTKKVTLEQTDVTGSDESIWVGSSTGKPTINVSHFKNANNFEGVKAGDIIRVTAEATPGHEGDTYKLLTYSGNDTNWSWTNYEGMDAVDTDTGFEFTVTEDNVSIIKTDGIIVNQGGYTIYQVELIPAKEEMTDLYIVGDFDGWNTATNTPNLVKMTYNEETEAFEKEVTVTSTAYFVFGDVASSDSWDDFNANNRYAASDDEAEVVEGQPIQLQKATGTLKISNPGTYTLSVTKDLLLSITQTSAGEDTYIVAGTPASIFGTEWDGTNEDNKMTFDETTGTYSITYNVTEATNDVQLKVVKNQSEWIGDATGNNVTFNVTSPCEITITYNPETGEITVTGDGVVFPTDFTYEAVYAVGNGSEGWLNNVAWDPAAEANKMTEVEEDVWEITYSAVPVGTGYQVKFAIDGGWTNNFGGTFAAFNEETDAVYNGDNITFDVADEAKDITIRLDLKDFDFASKTGAKFTIKTAGEEPEPEPTADGDIISWTADDIASAGGTASSYSVGDFVLNVVDTDGKIAVDANTAYFGDATAQKKFTHRLKTGGKSSSKNSLTLTVPSAGKVKVYVRTGSNSATDRNLTLTQNGTTLYDKVVQESDAVQVAEDDLNVTNEEPAAGAKALAEGDPATVKVYPAVEIDAVAGTVEIGYPTGSLNFYGFEFISDEVTGIQNVETLDINPMFDENLPAYNLAGQRVDKNYRGVVIQKGKKFFNK